MDKRKFIKHCVITQGHLGRWKHQHSEQQNSTKQRRERTKCQAWFTLYLLVLAHNTKMVVYCMCELKHLAQKYDFDCIIVVVVVVLILALLFCGEEV